MVFAAITNLTFLHKITSPTLILNTISVLKQADFQGASKMALQEAMHGGLQKYSEQLYKCWQKFVFAEVPPVF
jgi:hypothetical protein